MYHQPQPLAAPQESTSTLTAQQVLHVTAGIILLSPEDMSCLRSVVFLPPCSTATDSHEGTCHAIFENQVLWFCKDVSYI